MKLIIDIDENDYKFSIQCVKSGVGSKADKFIANGIPYEERPQGEWLRTALYGMTCYECNNCHLHYDLRSFFCPICGADMRGTKNDR